MAHVRRGNLIPCPRRIPLLLGVSRAVLAHDNLRNGTAATTSWIEPVDEWHMSFAIQETEGWACPPHVPRGHVCCRCSTPMAMGHRTTWPSSWSRLLLRMSTTHSTTRALEPLGWRWGLRASHVSFIRTTRRLQSDTFLFSCRNLVRHRRWSARHAFPFTIVGARIGASRATCKVIPVRELSVQPRGCRQRRHQAT